MHHLPITRTLQIAVDTGHAHALALHLVTQDMTLDSHDARRFRGFWGASDGLRGAYAPIDRPTKWCMTPSANLVNWS